MNKVVKKTVCLLMCLAMLFTITGCSEVEGMLSDLIEIADTLEKNHDTDTDIPEDFFPSEDFDTSAPESEDNSADGFTESNTGSADNNSSDKNIGSSNTASGGNQSSNTSSNSSESKGKTVRMMLWREPTNAEKKAIDSFQKSTKINVKYSVVNQKEYTTRVAARIAGGLGLDICAIQSGGMSVLTGDTYPSSFPIGTIHTMQPFFEVTGQNPNDSIWAKSWMEPYKFNNKYYGVAIAGGWNTLSTVIYYNKDLFEENGITTPRELWKAGNWNWDTFKAAALEISDIDDYYVGYAGRDSYAYMLSAGCDYVGFDGKRFTNTSNTLAMRKAWEFSNEMISSGAQFRPDGSSNFPQLFIQGKFGMYGESSYCMLDIGMMGDYAYHLDNVDFEIDAVPFPSPKGQEHLAIHRGNLFGIAKNAAHPVEAGAFLRFWLDPKNSTPFDDAAINGNMKDVFNWINSESTVKKPFLSGGVLGYQNAERMGSLTYSLMMGTPYEIPTTIGRYQQFINTSVAEANKVIQ